MKLFQSVGWAEKDEWNSTNFQLPSQPVMWDNNDRQQTNLSSSSRGTSPFLRTKTASLLRGSSDILEGEISQNCKTVVEV